MSTNTEDAVPPPPKKQKTEESEDNKTDDTPQETSGELEKSTENKTEKEEDKASEPPKKKQKTETEEPMDEELATKIREQVEFYFSDSNFPRDKFLKQKAEAHPEGFVALSVIASFNRMRKLSTNLELIEKAVSSSPHLIVKNGEVKRSAPLPEEDTSAQRTVVVTGLPEDTTIDSAKDFFSAHGQVLSVRVPRERNTSKCKGTGFIEFDSEDTVNTLITKSDIKMGDNALAFVTKAEYFKQRKEQREKQKRKRGEFEEESKEEEKEKTFTPGVLISVQGVKGKSEEDNDARALMYDLKAVFEDFGSVGYVDLGIKPKEETVGDITTVVVRMEDADSTQKAIEGANGKDFNGSPLACSLMKDEEEKAYWEKIWEQQKKYHSSGGVVEEREKEEGAEEEEARGGAEV
eukprot:CAMPEP_0174260540 /NCGR_PEP_ID=MMETSP0439-20130205/9896_1 /TAXON_ID=0 /ORGANISM="Stereomyxa ramosa, Strain Chinc5" /LENGTH=405 /DNA_ID=CAMNT_0015344803 /DNA_START=24 /DNA_END=1238 /DNA_ORIENTATION=-